MERFKSVLNSLNKKTLITILAIVATLSAMFFGGVNMLSQGKKSAEINTPEISTEIDDKVSASANIQYCIYTNGTASSTDYFPISNAAGGTISGSGPMYSIDNQVYIEVSGNVLKLYEGTTNTGSPKYTFTASP
ncbi:MAG: hypothetical protein ACI4TT_02145, partial [Christensenellales bacterium]